MNFGGNETILLVEDDDNVRDLYTQFDPVVQDARK